MTHHDSEPPSAVTGVRVPPPAVINPHENVFTVLGDNARSRSRAALWTTAIGGGLNAVLVWWQYPSASWLAAGFVAAAAYGGWGLLDRAITAPESRSDAEGTADAMPEIRGLLAVVGTAAAVWAVLGFMASALGNWNH